LSGWGGNDRLIGGAGNDTLIGGAGNDTFVFDAMLGESNIDNIADFSVVHDTIHLNEAVFASLPIGMLTVSAFSANLTGAASDPLDRIIYESNTGRLYFDEDGTGPVLGTHFATLAVNLAMTNADFFIF
jgi:Ca2+-binding RTX toxin-like protein